MEVIYLISRSTGGTTSATCASTAAATAGLTMHVPVKLVVYPNVGHGFSNPNDERDVFVYRRGSRWDDSWWFAGLRKVSAKVSETKTSSSLKKAYESGKKEGAREMAQAIQNKPHGEMMKVLSEYLKEK